MDSLFDIDMLSTREDLTRIRTCALCYQEKNITEFEITTQTRKKVYRKSGCRPCIKARRLDEKSLKKIYGSTRPLGTPCDNCGKRDLRLSLDHCHDTGEFRGWLCQSCNTSIGMLGDDIESLRKTVEYLERSKLGLHKTDPVNVRLDLNE